MQGLLILLKLIGKMYSCILLSFDTVFIVIIIIIIIIIMIQLRICQEIVLIVAGLKSTRSCLKKMYVFGFFSLTKLCYCRKKRLVWVTSFTTFLKPVTAVCTSAVPSAMAACTTLGTAAIFSLVLFSLAFSLRHTLPVSQRETGR